MNNEISNLTNIIENFLYLTKNDTSYRHKVLTTLINNKNINEQGRIFTINLLSIGNSHFSIFRLGGNINKDMFNDNCLNLIQKVLENENNKLSKL